ncbi:hypothetical protein LTS12_020836 [Elasticomyces elasticus]|nr:hypothetical protein LTS12_020836 [Elasticomyces elasticus]
MTLIHRVQRDFDAKIASIPDLFVTQHGEAHGAPGLGTQAGSGGGIDARRAADGWEHHTDAVTLGQPVVG